MEYKMSKALFEERRSVNSFDPNKELSKDKLKEINEKL